MVELWILFFLNSRLSLFLRRVIDIFPFLKGRLFLFLQLSPYLEFSQDWVRRNVVFFEVAESND
jgi:hypothetical protein